MTSAVRLAQFTDLHLFSDNAGAWRGVNTHASFLATLEHARATHWPVDGIILTGDLVHDESAAGYRILAQIIADENIPVYCVPGNHDNIDYLTDILSRAGCRVNGSDHLIGEWQIILLNSQAPGEVRGRLAPEELEKLEASCARHPDKPALVALHHHPVPVESTWLDNVMLENAAELHAQLRNHPRAQAVLCGHIHQILDKTDNGIRFLGTPSTCAQFKPQSNAFAMGEYQAAYRILELFPDGKLDTNVIWVEY
ncbi:MAG: 3',5'-cyclic-AMP phosphodiesterase [Gammaproteobacteria bacterium]|nr:3',5'-cyclic-AMP phosphodiesterase [Gammaproteobacteria bacterium]